MPLSKIVQNSVDTPVAGTGPAFSAYQSTQQTGVSQIVTTTVVLDGELFDTASRFNNTGATVGGIPAYSFMPNVAGYYLLTFGISVQTASASAWALAILLGNGASIKQGASGMGVAGVLYPQSSGSAVVYFNGTSDYVTLGTYASNGTATYSLVNNYSATYFTGCLIRAV